jgi:hypothetical protein
MVCNCLNNCNCKCSKINLAYVTCSKCGSTLALNQSADHIMTCRKEQELNKIQRVIHNQFYKDCE